jgi:hypothetical protein
MNRFFALILVILGSGCGDGRILEPTLAPPAEAQRNFVNEGCTGIICGPNYIYIESSGTEFFTWTAYPTAGTPPYTYSWEIHYDLWGSGAVGGNSPSVYFGVGNTDYHFSLEVTVRDAYNTVVHNDWHRVLVCDTPTFC